MAQQQNAEGRGGLKTWAGAVLRRFRLFGRLHWTYLVHVLALLLPGHAVPVVKAHPNEAKELTGWCDSELNLMIDEGRRQGDRQIAALEEIRGRAQWVFLFGAPLVVAAASVYGEIEKSDSDWWKLVWLLGVLGVGYGVVGAASILTVRADLNMIDTAVLSTYERPILKALAADYAEMMRVGENTVATRLTLFRQAVVWLVLGGTAALITWLSVR
jgi:hypothetical protein